MKPVLLFILLTPFYCFAQQSKQVEEFNKAYYNSIDKLRKLEFTKGASVTACDLDAGADFFAAVKEQINNYEYGQGQANTYGVLYYSYDNSVLRVWLIGSNKFAYKQVTATADSLSKAEMQLRAAMKTGALKRTPKKRGGVELLEEATVDEIPLEKAIQNMTHLLLPAEISTQLTGIKKLVVIPEFNVGQIPFYLLKPFNNEAYLIDSMAVSITPHLCNFDAFYNKNSYEVGKENKLSKGVKALVVGDPEYSDGKYILPDLPGAKEEAQTIASAFNTQALLGKEATKAKVLKGAQSAKFLYFATHGVFDYDKLLEGSFLALTPDSSDEDGFWTAKEIEGAYLGNAQLAVLSACQTGVGKIHEAGFIGIGRAFYTAGVDNTIVSLWSVDDLATRKLMEIFLLKLKKPQYFYPAENLRQAILEFKKQDPNPAHWAPFVNFGFCY